MKADPEKGYSYRDLGRFFGISHIHVYWICNPKKYRKSLDAHAVRAKDGRYRDPEREKESKKKSAERKRDAAARFNLPV